MTPDDHEQWSELAAGYALSALDDADHATYLEHAATCDTCRQLEQDLSEVMSELAHATPAATPPPSLKASIMQAIAEDDDRRAAPVVSISERRPVVGLTAVPANAGASADITTTRRTRRMPMWMAAAAAVVFVAAVGGVWVGTSGHKPASVAARCAKVHCPTVTLTAAGKSVGAVMVLDHTAYVQTEGLPSTPAGTSYVLWYVPASGTPVGIGAVATSSSAGPVRAGSFDKPMTTVTGFAVSDEPGTTVPAAPSHVLATGPVT